MFCAKTQQNVQVPQFFFNKKTSMFNWFITLHDFHMRQENRKRLLILHDPVVTSVDLLLLTNELVLFAVTYHVHSHV